MSPLTSRSTWPSRISRSPFSRPVHLGNLGKSQVTRENLMARSLKLRVIARAAALSLVVCAVAPAFANPVHTEGATFKDAAGRTLILRGVNLGGSSKIPFRTSSDPRDVSYVGRPFPLAEADEHFRRLQSWGLTTVRLIVVWEAVEHAGPGEYD